MESAVELWPDFQFPVVSRSLLPLSRIDFADRPMGPLHEYSLLIEPHESPVGAGLGLRLTD
jgi:hypothetical protein